MSQRRDWWKSVWSARSMPSGSIPDASSNITIHLDFGPQVLRSATRTKASPSTAVHSKVNAA